ncbi:hypothetical protein L1D26_08380 [Vibrio mediterranei]|uniref:hypothetical protein n=1 Tax=Vibrio mediterranei TaxID=689 RepID=UPI001EFCE2B0|nr:hypothetical protein [Vibrio mediterranei]MCG9663072.1 hypothetical protein [Vibrio mediterranei]
MTVSSSPILGFAIWVLLPAWILLSKMKAGPEVLALARFLSLIEVGLYLSSKRVGLFRSV